MNIELLPYRNVFEIHCWWKFVWTCRLSKWARCEIKIDNLAIIDIYQRIGYWTAFIRMLQENYSLEWEYTVTSLWFYEKLWAKIKHNKFYFKCQTTQKKR